MRRGALRTLAVTLLAIGFWLLPGAAPTGATVDSLPDDLSNLIITLVEGGCVRLNPYSSSSLSSVCSLTSGIPNESGSAAANVGTAAALLESKLYDRTKQRRTNADAASAGLLGDAANGLGGRLGVFGAYEFERYDKNLTPYEAGYSADQHNGLFGIDYRFDTWLLGAAFHVSKQEGSYDNGGGSFFVDSGGATVYASFFPVQNLFVDVTASYAHKDYEFNRNVELFTGAALTAAGTHKGVTSGHEYRFAVNSGYDFTFGRATVGPRLGFAYAYNTMNGYVENDVSVHDNFASEVTGLELAYDDQQWDSATLNVGVYASYAISTPVGVLIPQLTASYVHEFLRGQRVIYFHFAGDASQTRFRFKTDRPDRDYVLVSLGLLWQAPHGITPFLNYRALAAYRDHASHTVTAGVRFSF